MSFAEAWTEAEKRLAPEEYAGAVVIDWEVFADKVRHGEESFVRTFVDSIYSGHAWFLKGAFGRGFMDDMRLRCNAWESVNHEGFHKMLDGCPDFHRIIDLETGKKYSIKGCKHSAYFFRWNDDPIFIWSDITSKWRVIKKAMGLNSTEYEFNVPSQGPTDRIQVVRYPPSIGYLEPHIDAHQYQRCFISGYMSKEGIDYKGGGFYFVKDGKAVEAESLIDVGDLCIGYATVPHGVAPCDRGVEPDWSKSDGRWFLGLYSNASDYQTNRFTAAPFKCEIEGVLP